MTHPLTNEMCEKIQLHIFSQTDEDCMRSAYDLGESKGRADMLERVFEWLYNNLYLVEEDGSIRYLDTHNSYGELVAIDRHQIIDDLEAAMRPQVVDLPQANSDVCGEEGMERARQQTFDENDELMRLLADS